jgi:tetratricopeptide (TPR) repeat protein
MIVHFHGKVAWSMQKLHEPENTLFVISENHADFEDSHTQAVLTSIYGNTLFSQGLYSEALGYFTKSLRIFRMVHLKPNPQVYRCLQNIARCHEALGDYVTANHKFVQAFRLQEMIDRNARTDGYRVLRTNARNYEVLKTKCIKTPEAKT